MKLFFTNPYVFADIFNYWLYDGKTDHLTPVITLVVYLGKDEWDGPRTLRDMYRIKDPVLLAESLDYKLKLIEPNHMSDADIEKFQSNMREVLLFLRSANDKNQLYQLAEEEKFRDMDPVAAHLLNEITQSNLKLAIQKGKGKIQMCEAIKGIREDGIKEGLTQGISQGISQGLCTGQGKLILTYMQKNNCALETALDFFDIAAEDRSGIVEYVTANI